MFERIDMRLWGRTLIQCVGFAVAVWSVLRLPLRHYPTMAVFAVFLGLEILMYVVSTVQRPKKISGNGWAWAASLIIAVYPTLTPNLVRYPLHSSAALVVVGTGLQYVACVVEIVALWKLNRSFSQVPEANRLVTSGLYRYVRHPLYTAYFLGFGGFTLLVNQPLLWLAFVVFAGLEVVRAKAEERVLLETFPEYEGYMRHTGMFVPKQPA